MRKPVTDHPIRYIRNLKQSGRERGEHGLETKPQDERRKCPRKDCFISVELGTRNHACTEFATNVSTRGIYIETKMAFSPKDLLVVVFAVPGVQHSVFKIPGRMVWRDKIGVGLQFIEEADEIEHFVDKLPRISLAIRP